MTTNMIDINDLARQLKVSTKTIRNKLSNGTWPLAPVRIGRALRWRQSEVERLMNGELKAEYSRKNAKMNIIDKARETVRDRLNAGNSASAITADLISVYGEDLPSIAIMAYGGNKRVDGVLHVAARKWVRINTTFTKKVRGSALCRAFS